MAPRSSSAVAGAAVLAGGSAALLKTAFVSASGTRSVAAHAPRVTAASVPVKAAAAAAGESAAGAIMGAAMGLAGTAAVAAGAVRRSRVAARVAKGQPSLIQVLEQKQLLSLVERLGLLSTAERAGVKADAVEKLGLLKFAEERGLLSFAENTLCSPNTPIVLLLAAAAGVAGVYLDLTESATLGFTQWVIAGALGVPSLILAVAAVVIFSIFGGITPTRNLDLTETTDVYTAGGEIGNFTTKTTSRPVTLLNVVEEKGLLSFAEENGLISLATSVVKNPLTLTENARVLSTLESTKLLSAVESTASDTYGAAGYGLTGLAIITAAVAAALLVPDYGALAGLALALPGLGYLGVGLGLSVVQAPRKS